MSIVQADLYPSRQHNHPRWQDRLDPIAWRKDAPDSPLTEQQLSRFERDGFLVIENLFSAEEVAVFKAELQRMSKDPKVLEAPTAIREPDSGALRSVFAIHRDNPLFARVARDERTAGLVRHLLDGDIYVHQSRLNLKPASRARSSTGTPTSRPGTPRTGCRACCHQLLHPADRQPPLERAADADSRVAPALHQLRRADPENHYQQSLRRQEFGIPDEDSLTRLVERYGIEQATGPAGSVVLFDCNTIHGSGSNIAPSPRSNLFFVYNHIDNRPEAPFDGMPPRPDFVAERGPVEPLDIGPQHYRESP